MAISDMKPSKRSPKEDDEAQAQLMDKGAADEMQAQLLDEGADDESTQPAQYSRWMKM